MFCDEVAALTRGQTTTKVASGALAAAPACGVAEVSFGPLTVESDVTVGCNCEILAVRPWVRTRSGRKSVLVAACCSFSLQ